MTDQATRQSIRQFTADPQAPKGRMLRALERSGVDVLGDHARKAKPRLLLSNFRAEAYMIDEVLGIVAIGETYKALERDAMRSFRKLGKKFSRVLDKHLISGPTHNNGRVYDFSEIAEYMRDNSNTVRGNNHE